MKHRPSVHQFGPFDFDPSQHELRSGEDRATLPAALNKLLLLLVTRPGELVTRDEIAAALWEDQATVDVAAGINTAIRRLRTQLGDGNGHGTFIETVVGAGYRFAAPVSVAPVEEPAVDLPAPTPRRLWPLAAVFVLVLLAAAGVWTLHLLQRAASQASGSAAKPLLSHSHPVTFDELEDRLSAQAISPSGTYLAFADRAGITLHTLATGEDRLLDTPPALAIDRISWVVGEHFLLVSGVPAKTSKPASPDPSRPQTWRVSLDGAPAQLVLDDAALATASPTDGRIALLRAHQTEVWLFDSNGNAPHLFLKAPDGDTFTCLLWSPRGDRIVVDRNHPRLPNLAGANLNAQDSSPSGLDNSQVGAVYESYSAANGSLLASRDGLRFDSAVLLADGNLLFAINSPSDEAKFALIKTDPATGTVLATERLLPSHQVWSSYRFNRVAQLSASTDGKTVSALLDRNASDVYTADLSTTSSGSRTAIEHIARLTRHAGSSYPTAWSPDGTAVIFDNGIAGPIAIAAQPLDGSPFKVLAESKNNLSKFAQGQFSPDGRWLLYLDLVMDNGHVQSIDRVPAHGGVPEVVHTKGQIEEFHCSTSAAGRCVLREVDGKKSLVYYTLDPVLGIGDELGRTRWQPNLLGDWTLSPDGSTVAMADHDPTHPCIQLVTLAPTSAHERETRAVKEIPVTGFGTTLASHWSADGKGFFVETYTGTQYDLVWVALDGHTSLLAQSPDLLWAIPSPDGKKIAFPGRTPLNRNVWIGTNASDTRR